MTEHCVECERLAAEASEWNDWADRQRARYAMKHAECERLQAELDALQVKFTDACFEVDRMRPVVEAAMEYVDVAWGSTPDAPLRDAVDAYRAAKGADDD